MNFEFLILLISITLSFLIAFILYNIILFLIQKDNTVEKLSAYECGFHPFEDPRQNFNVRFYLVSILFLVFDLEVIFIFPWVISSSINLFAYKVIIIFLLVLVVVFIYEWVKGGLVWE